MNAMKAYTIFDDFTKDAADIMSSVGMSLTIHPHGVPRPDPAQMKAILEKYDVVIIGTSQKITEDMFENISSPRIIATASVGVDHIRVPADKRALVTVINTPRANAQSVAEYTMGCALSCIKRLSEGGALYRAGRNNKALHQKPEDLAGKTMGVIGAGNISAKIMEFAGLFGMRVLCWTAHPERHTELRYAGVEFCGLPELCQWADVISVNLPNNEGTRGLISAELVSRMKDMAVFISVSRLPTIDLSALLEKAEREPGFYVCVDIDVDETVVQALPDLPNVLVTPHIAGGTEETRKRMFREVAESIREIILAS